MLAGELALDAGGEYAFVAEGPTFPTPLQLRIMSDDNMSGLKEISPQEWEYIPSTLHIFTGIFY